MSIPVLCITEALSSSLEMDFLRLRRLKSEVKPPFLELLSPSPALDIIDNLMTKLILIIVDGKACYHAEFVQEDVYEGWPRITNAKNTST